MFNQIYKQVDSIKAEANSSHNELAISMQNSNSSFSKTVKRSCGCFYHNMHNTLTYFLKKH